MPSISEHIAKCRELGFNVVPLQTRSKVTLAGFDLKRYFSELYTAEIPDNSNYAVICGKVSKLIVVDLDGEEAKRIMESKLATFTPSLKEKFEKTYAIRTGGGGYHFYFKLDPQEYPEGYKQVKLYRGQNEHTEIMIRGNGNYVVGESSIHPNGNTYQGNNKEPATLSRVELEEFVSAFVVINNDKPHANVVEPSYTNELTPDKIKTVVDMIKPFYTKGQRDELVFVLSGHLRKSGVPQSITENLISLLSAGDEERDNRLVTVRQTYSKPISEIKGYSGLEGILGEALAKELAKIVTPADPVSPSKYKQLADKYGLAEDMLKHVGAVIQDWPPQLVVANTDDRRVKIGHIESKDKIHPETGEVIGKYYYIFYTDTILDAIPERITIIKDPLEDVTKYEVELVSANGDINTFGPLTFTEVIKKIEDTPLCFKPRSLQSYLAPLLRAYIESSRVEHKTEIDREGFFYVDGKLQGSKIEIMPVNSTQAKEAVRFIETLKTQFYSKQRDTSRLAHCLRLAVVAPFDFARRQMGVAGNNNFIPRLDQYGWANTGKTYGYPKIILRIWRREVEDYLKGNGSVDTAARFIKQTSNSTMPLVLDEVDFTSSWEKDGRVQNYIAILKNQCSMTHPRDTLTKESEIVSRPSLAFPILTHNSDRITEDGFVKRYVGFGYTPDDEISKEREASFSKFLEEHKETNGVIGDFVAGHIVANQDLLSKPWEAIAEAALRALYELAAEPAPAWLWSKVEHSSLNDTKESREGQIKAATLDMINAAWTQNRHELTDKNENRILSLSEKIERLVQNNMLPHIRLHKTEGICLLSSYVEHLKEKYKITRISMAQLASICQWRQPHNVRLGELNNPKVVSVPLERFVAFLTDTETATQTSFL